MSKVYFIPDVHLQEFSPRSRKDSYPTTVINKLEYIAEYINSNNGITIFLGDIFNAVNMPMIYMYRVIDVFKKFKEIPYTVIGNHDLARNNPDLIDRTPIGLLNNIGLIKWCKEIDLDNVVIRGFHYTEPIQSNTSDKKSICVAHCFYEDNFAETHNLHIKDILALNYNYFVLGHDHTPYEDAKVGDSIIYRPGSLTRGTANDNQMTRDNVYILEYDTLLDKFTKIPIPCQPAKEVFYESVFMKKEMKYETQKILDNLTFTNNDNIYDVLDKSEQSDEIKQIVEEYLQAAGIYRNNIGGI